MFQQLSKLSTNSPWLCLVYGVVLPFLCTLCLLSICTTTIMVTTMADDQQAQHLLERSLRDVNNDNNEGSSNDIALDDDSTVDDQMDNFEKQMDGGGNTGGGGGGGESIGTFLGNISSTARAQLYNIVNNQNMTKKETNDAIDTWAQAQGQPFYTIYLGLKAAYEAARQQLDQQHVEIMKNQSQAVREADAKIQTIDNNQFITLAEEKRQMAEQMAQFPADVQQALLQLAPYPYSKK